MPLPVVSSWSLPVSAPRVSRCARTIPCRVAGEAGAQEEDRVRPGQCVYVPRGWWHQVSGRGGDEHVVSDDYVVSVNLFEPKSHVGCAALRWHLLRLTCGQWLEWALGSVAAAWRGNGDAVPTVRMPPPRTTKRE